MRTHRKVTTNLKRKKKPLRCVLTITAKQRYDLKRRGTQHRLELEAERYITRRMIKHNKLKRLGSCEICGMKGKTVFHHLTYQREQSLTQELCYKCHRKVHPRVLPHGAIV